MGERGYQPNLDLKAYLNKQWEGACSARRLQLAKVIVSDWGGIRGNKPSEYGQRD